ncbi:MAG: endonuclease [Bacteroidales bacterium]|jgi:endonuclease I|nr:endonuclease [Bacteroidales bacterium]
MKKVKYFLFYFILFYFINFNLLGQIPTGYYNGAENLTGDNLRTFLFNKIKTHTQLSYGDLWTAFQQTDKKSDGRVWDMYSNCLFTFVSNQCGNYNSECDCYNREHSFPDSWFHDAAPMHTDIFHMYPTDGWVNNKRGNLPFGEVGTATYTSGNGSRVGSARNGLGYYGNVYEPLTEYKGDFARTYFYMLTCYKDKISGWNSDMLLGDNFSNWAKNMLIAWSINDAVSEKEINRNNIIYTNFQYNRNPFIDCPEYARLIWDESYQQPTITINSPQNNFSTSSSSVEVNFHINSVEQNLQISYYLNNTLINCTSESSVTINNLISGNNTIKLIVASHDCNCPLVSQQIIVQKTGITSIEENKIEETKIYYNSDSDNIILSHPNKKIKDVFVLDITGKVILKEQVNNLETNINAYKFENGIYIVSVHLESGEIFNEKIIIIK